MNVYKHFLRYFNLEPAPQGKVRKARAEGPFGRVNSYKWLAQQNRDAWYSSTQQAGSTRKTIIFADSIGAYRETLPVEFELWDALLTMHNVYLWQGGEVPLANCETVKSSQAMYEQRGSIQNATKNEILSSLAKQGLDVKQFVVLDVAEYYQYLYQLICMHHHIPKSDKHHPATIPYNHLVKYTLSIIENLTDETGQKFRPEIQNVIDGIKARKLMPPKSEVMEVKLFVEKDYFFIGNDHVFTELDFSQYNETGMVKFTSINGETENVNLKELSSIGRILIYNCTTLERIIGLPDTVNEINILNCPALRALDLNKVDILRSLNLVNLPQLDLDTNTHFPFLEHLRLVNLNRIGKYLTGLVENAFGVYSIEIKSMGFEHLSFRNRIRSICIENCTELRQLDVSRVTDLSVLMMVDCPKANYPLMPDYKINHESIHNLEKESYQGRKVKVTEKLDALFDYSSQINSAQRVKFSGVNVPDLSSLPSNLWELHLIDCDFGNQPLDLSKFTCLRTIVISGRNLRIIENLPDSLGVVNIKCKEDLQRIDLKALKHLDALVLNVPSQCQIECNEDGFKEIEYLELRNLTNAAILSVKKVDLLFFHNYKGDTLPAIAKKVQELHIVNCPNLRVLDLERYRSVKSLVVKKCHQLTTIKALPESIKAFTLSENLRLNIPSLINCKQLDIVILLFNNILEDIRDKRVVDQAEIDLFVERNTKATNNYPSTLVSQKLLQGDPLLPEEGKYIVFHANRNVGCALVPNLYFIDAYSIEVAGCVMPEVSKLPVNVNECEFSNCYSITGFLNFTGFDRLIRLKINNIQDLEEIICPANLAILEIEDASQLKILNLTLCTELEVLELKNLPPDLRIIGLDKLTKLRKTNLVAAKAEILARNRDLNAFNNEHQTALMSVHTVSRPDAITGAKNVKHSYENSDCKVTIYHPDNLINKHHYRFNSFTHIEYSVFSSNVSFLAPKPDEEIEVGIEVLAFEKNTVAHLKRFCDEKPEWAAGMFAGTLQPNKRYALTTSPLNNPITDILMYCNAADNLNFKLVKDNQRLYVMLKPGVGACKVELAYRFKVAPQYILRGIPSDSSPVTQPENLLGFWLRIRIIRFIANNPQFSYLNDPLLSVHEKLTKLYEHCSHFKEEKSEYEDEIIYNIEVLLNNFANQRGVCRHRAQAFALFAQFLNVPVSVEYNQSHAFVEIPFIVNGVKVFKGLELGGGAMLDLTPVEVRGADPFAVIKAELELKPEALPELEPVSIEEIPQDKEMTVSEAVAVVVQRIVETEEPEIMPEYFPKPKTVTSVQELLKPVAKRGPVIQLTKNQSADEVIKAILKEIPTERYLCVRSAQDIIDAMDTVIIKDGERRIVPGPLCSLLEEGGLLIIDWTNFTATEKSSYMSVLVKEATLRGVTRSAACQVVGLINPRATEACEAFTSRTTPYFLDVEYIPEPVQKWDQAATAHLNGLPFWEEALLCDVVQDKTGTHYQVKALIEAIQNQQSLTIYQPPDDPEFKAFINRVLTERQFIFNGEIYKVPAEFNIICEDLPYENRADNVVVDTAEAPSDKRLFLSANNIHDCYQRKVVDNQSQQYQPAISWLDHPDHQKFYITDFISRSEWQELIKYAKTKDRQFTFTLLPGAEIEGVAAAPHNQQRSANSQFIFSNDPDYCAQQLKQQYENCHIVDITPTTSFLSLIANIKEVREKDGSVAVSYQEKSTAKRLTSNQTVILTGCISPDLYQVVLPYLACEQAVIYHNDEVAQVNGRLICVSPVQNLDVLNYNGIRYTIDDYRKHFSEDKQALIDNIAMLFNLIQKLPHSGIGFPAKPELNFQRLQNIISRIERYQSLPHRENPIKGILHSDYPKHSINYHFLNTIAKAMFSQNDNDKTIREYKAKKIIAKYNIQTIDDLKKHLWTLLNCCHAGLIRELVCDLSRDIYFDNNLPVLSDEIIGKFYELLKPIIQNDIQQKAEKHNYKPAEQLTALVAEGHTKAIVLKGPPGTSKTHSLRELKASLPPNHYFKGLDQIIAWFNAKPKDKNRVVIHFDEANMEDPDTWNLLKALMRGDLTVDYRGVSYTLTPEHLAVFSCNPETYPNRHFHSFFREYAETILYPIASDTWIHEQFILPALRNIPNCEFISEKLLWAFNHIIDYNPLLVVSLRDVKALVQRFLFIYEIVKDTDLAIAQTLIVEFAHSIPDLDKRAKFCKFVIPSVSEGPRDNSVQIISGIYIPAEKLPLFELITQDIKIAEQAALANKPHRYGILLEGPSGIGKSSIYKAILNDMQKDFYEVTVDATDKAAYLLLKVFLTNDPKKYIILDEINLNPKLESLLNDLMEGVVPDAPEYQDMIKEIAGENPKIRQGCMVFGSINPGEMTGRNAVSLALYNRFHRAYFEDYSKEALLDILHAAKIPHAQELLNQFLQAKQENPELINTRKFFDALQDVAPKPKL